MISFYTTTANVFSIQKTVHRKNFCVSFSLFSLQYQNLLLSTATFFQSFYVKYEDELNILMDNPQMAKCIIKFPSRFNGKLYLEKHV